MPDENRIDSITAQQWFFDATHTFTPLQGNAAFVLNSPTASTGVCCRGATCTTALTSGNYRLPDAVVYSTIEPCAMCAGALIQARVKLLIYGATDEKAGAVESHFQICDAGQLNHRVEVIKGVLASECRELMQEFFKARR